MAKHSESKPLPSWLTLVIFLLCMTVLWVFGDLFVFILGLIFLGFTFANNYDRKPHTDEEHH